MLSDPIAGERMIGRIPVKNLWLLMLYASELTRFTDRFRGLVEADCDDLPDLVAELLAQTVEYRLRRNLTRGYQNRRMVLTRVRGRIDVLTTEAHQLLSKGEVACCFHDLTIDTPRNRLVRSALDLMARLVRRERLAQRSRSLASSLARLGVGGIRPSRSDLVVDQIGRNDTEDLFMVALAHLAFDLELPTEVSGPTALAAPEREEVWVRRLFEKAVLGFAQVELEPLGWSVRGSIPFDWQVSSRSKGIAAILPRMVTDIVIDPPNTGRRLIVDTKFTSILGVGRFGGTGLKSDYLYQMYAYLRSQEGQDQRWDRTDGLLLHPAIDVPVHEYAVIQGHTITFATVNLTDSPVGIRARLRDLLSKWSRPSAL
jgi:5-methylcytosine-specific restriction enzyme subunit McrC